MRFLLLRPSFCLLFEYQAHLYFQIYRNTHMAKTVWNSIWELLSYKKNIKSIYILKSNLHKNVQRNRHNREKSMSNEQKNIGRFFSENLTETHLSHGLHLKQHEPKICLTLWVSYWGNTCTRLIHPCKVQVPLGRQIHHCKLPHLLEKVQKNHATYFRTPNILFLARE